MKLSFRSLFLCLLSVLPLLALPAAATTFQMVEDSTLTDQARAIVRARVVDVEPSTLGGRPATDYIVEVDRVLKGDVPGSTIVVRVPGGLGADGVGLKIWGAPEMARFETALLFLQPADDGTFRVLHLMLGAFHRQPGQGRSLALRDLSETQQVGSEGLGPARDQVRDFDRFADWIADRAAGIVRERDYLVTGVAGQPRSAVDAFTQMKGDDGNPIRWFEFDSGRSVEWRVHNGGQPGLGLDASIAAFQVAMNAWNNDRGSNIRYTYAGTTSTMSGFDDSDNVNTILFNDPGDTGSEGSFDCGSGGVIAVGGPWFYESTRPYRGKAYHEAAEADIVTNDGTECFFQDNPRVAEEVFAHELGHTLGLGHSASREALMYARAHDDSRGARLHPDDLAAVAEVYAGGGTQPPGGGPKPPTELTLVSREANSVTLSWLDNSNDETDFRLERKVGGGSFREIQTLEENTTGAIVGDLRSGLTYSFRVRASNASGLSTYSNVVKVRMGGSTLAAPAELTAVARSSARVLLTWQDKSTGETAFRIERSVNGGPFRQLVRVAPADATRIVLRGLTAGTTYEFRIRAVAADGSVSPYSNEVTVTTPAL